MLIEKGRKKGDYIKRMSEYGRRNNIGREKGSKKYEKPDILTQDVGSNKVVFEDSQTITIRKRKKPKREKKENLKKTKRND